MEAQTCTDRPIRLLYNVVSSILSLVTHRSSNVRQKHTSLGPLGYCNGDSDKPARMYSLINIFTGHTQKVATSDKSLYLLTPWLLQWRFRQACTNVQSHQYLHCSHTESINVRRKLISLGPQGCCNGDSDKPAHMYSLINTFTGHTQKVATSDKSLYLTIH